MAKTKAPAVGDSPPTSTLASAAGPSSSWRGASHPEKLVQAKELSYAASKLTSIRYQRHHITAGRSRRVSQMGARGAGRGSVFVVQRAALRHQRAGAGGGRRIDKAGLRFRRLELKDRLGPVLWQFAPTKKFDEADFGKFLELLPRKLEGRALRHVVEVRNDSSGRRVSSRCCENSKRPRRSLTWQISGDCGCGQRFCLCAAAEGRRQSNTCYPPKALDTLGETVSDVGRWRRAG